MSLSDASIDNLIEDDTLIQSLNSASDAEATAFLKSARTGSSSSNQTTLMRVIDRRRPELVSAVLEKLTKLNILEQQLCESRNKQQWSVLHTLVFTPNIEIFNIVFEKVLSLGLFEELILHRSNRNRTPLMIACSQYSELPIVLKLLEAIKDHHMEEEQLFAEDEDKETVFNIAVALAPPAVVQCLCDFASKNLHNKDRKIGDLLSRRTKRGRTVLTDAISFFYSNPERLATLKIITEQLAVCGLLQPQLDDSQDKTIFHKRTPLMFSVSNYSCLGAARFMIDLLSKKESSPSKLSLSEHLELEDDNQETCLMLAVDNAKKNLDTVILLLKYLKQNDLLQSELIRKDSFARNVLHRAAWDDDDCVDVFRVIFAHIDDEGLLNKVLISKNGDNRTPLEVAKEQENNKVERYLARKDVKENWRKSKEWFAEREKLFKSNDKETQKQVAKAVDIEKNTAGEIASAEKGPPKTIDLGAVAFLVVIVAIIIGALMSAEWEQ